MPYVAYECALTPDQSRVVPVKQFTPTLQTALRDADAVVTAGGFFNLRIEADDGHLVFSEDEIRARSRARAPSSHTMPLAAAAAPV
ncbi:MAG: hypothetical protein ACREE2_10960 [Stellaceae bacterium]